MDSDTTKERSSCQSRLSSNTNLHNDPRFFRYSDYLKEKYGTTAYRVAVDAGFSCPNRSTNRSEGGCTYCDEFGARAAYSRRISGFDVTTDIDIGVSSEGNQIAADRVLNATFESKTLSTELCASIRGQVEHGMRFLSDRYRADTFLLYFQAFSNTHGEPEHLRAVYDYGLSLGDFRELIVATRPDCVNNTVAELLGSYVSNERDVWVELGLQTACNRTLSRIQRGHTVEVFEDAFTLLRAAGIKLACHLILGLPGESRTVMLQSIDYVAALRPEAVKIHDLHVPTGSAMYREFLRGELSVPTGARYLEYLTAAVERLPPKTILMRISCDTPVDQRAAPRQVIPKSALYNALTHELTRRDSYQGKHSGAATTEYD